MRNRFIGVLSAAVAAGLILGALAFAAGPQGDTKKEKPGAKWPECGTGPLQQIKDLDWMAGKWDVSVKWFAPPPSAETWTQSTESVIEPILSGTFLKETISAPFGKMVTNMIGVRSYDRFRDRYRLVFFDDVTTLADVFEGSMQGGELPMTNLRAGTSFMSEETGEQFMRITQKPGASRDEFTLKWEVSRDKGRSWRQTCEFSYKRKS